MFIVTKLSTGKVHITDSKDSFKTLCGQYCKSNIINDCNNGFGDIKDTSKILNVTKVTCKKCLKLFNKKGE
ncbi:hypothetical protein A3Q35_13300 [Aeribacillus pallidus]|nr:hypothetical protein A3Q35_13300 [Aeribacillus pallidus]